MKRLLVLQLSLVACGPLPEQRAHLAVDPAAIHFPGAFEGGQSIAPITLLNLGGAPLRLTALQVNGAGFSVEGCQPPLELDPYCSCDAEVRFSGGGRQATNGYLALHSNDPEQPDRFVTLAVPPARPALSLSPDRVDFGAVPSGKTVSRRIHVINLGRATARGLTLQWTSAAPDFKASLPSAELEPGTSTDLTVSYTPHGGDVDRATLALGWFDGDARTIELTGYQDLTAPH